MEADYIIAGGGSAGAVLAARLSENAGVRVLLLEAGGRDRNPLFHWPAGFARMTKGMASWGWSTVPQRNLRGREIWYTQAKVIGGGSSINAQIYTRGHPQDYDDWAEVHGCTGWRYAEVLPYFKRAEDNERLEDPWHARGGPLGVSDPRGALPICEAFIAAGEEMGLPRNPDFNGARQEGVGFYQLTQRNVRRSSTASAYLAPARNRRNLTILTGAEATRILVEEGRAVGVRYRHLGGEKVARARAEVIVAAGAIGSPRLLMLSGIGPGSVLRASGIDAIVDAPAVGENLQDHINLCALAECTGPYSYDGMDRLDRSLLAGFRYLLTRSGPVAASLFETGGFARSGPEATRPDIQFHLGQGSGIEKGILRLVGAGITINSAPLRPRSRGTVRLAGPDPRTAPLIDPNYWSEPEDYALSLRGLEMARAFLRQPALAPYIRREVLPGPEVSDDDGLFDYACRLAKTDHHPVGTCAMGAVVGPDLRVRGLDGLRICDASVMPALPSCNTNAPTIMIAEKGADLIRGRAQLSAAELPSPSTV